TQETGLTARGGTMKTNTSIGIWAVGAYLPDHVRTNDWWPKEIVAAWGERSTGKLDRPAEGLDELGAEGTRVVLEAMAEYRRDPFRGSRERRIIADGTLTSEMELAAARTAIARAGVDPQEIDLLLGTSNLPDYLMVPNACRIHEELKLASR